MSIRSRIDDYKASFSRLSSRERMALLGLGFTVFVLVVAAVSYVVVSSLDTIEQRNARMRKALKDLRQYGQLYMSQRQRMAALRSRMRHKDLELNSFVEKAAKKVEINIAESAEITPVEGEDFIQRGLEIKLRKVTIKQLAQLIKQLESSLQLVQITRLSVKTNWGQNKELNVEMVVATFEYREKKKEPVDKPSKRGKGKRRRKRS